MTVACQDPPVRTSSTAVPGLAGSQPSKLLGVVRTCQTLSRGASSERVTMNSLIGISPFVRCGEIIQSQRAFSADADGVDAVAPAGSEPVPGVSALRMFTEQGFDATTLDELADEAEVSKSTFFRFFPAKEAAAIEAEAELWSAYLTALADRELSGAILSELHQTLAAAT